MSIPSQKRWFFSSRSDRQKELAKRRTLFWAERLQLMPHQVEQMSQSELNHRLQVVKQQEQSEDHRNAEFERWKQLQQLRYLMYDEQRKYNERYGSSGGASIWRILAMAQQELEQKLQLDRIRGSCQRFPSPMSLMVEQREPGGGRQTFLEPVRSYLCGIHPGPATKEEEEEDDYLECRESDKTLIPMAKRSSLTPTNSLKDGLYEYPRLSRSKKCYNLYAERKDSLEESPDLGYCPLCSTRHLHLPPRF